MGALLSAVALGLVVVGVDTLGSDLHAAAAEIAAGLVGFAVLVLQQRQSLLPLLPLDLLRLPLFSLSLVTSVCSYSAQILAYLSLPFLFQTAMHQTQVATGLLMTPWPGLVAFAAPVAGRLAGRYPAGILGSAGLGVLAVGLVLLATMPLDAAYWDIVWRMGVCGVGFGFFQTPNNTTLMTAGPVARSGAAGGMIGVARTVGWCLRLRPGRRAVRPARRGRHRELLGGRRRHGRPRCLRQPGPAVSPSRLKPLHHRVGQSGRIATARVHPAEPRCTFTGNAATVNPSAGSASRLCSFSIWQ